MDIRNKIFIGDNTKVSAQLPKKSVNAIVTSPPYYNLRDYGVDGQMGSEDSPRAFVEGLVRLFGRGHLHDVLRDDGTLWVNLGDSYNNGSMIPADPQGMHGVIKPGDLIGTPMMFAYAMRDHGWYLRSTIIWEKPQGKPESVYDRPTNNFEYFFVFSKVGTGEYYYDYEAISEPYIDDAKEMERRANSGLAKALGSQLSLEDLRRKNRRAVWRDLFNEVNEAYQKYPPELVREVLLTFTAMLDLELPDDKFLSIPCGDIWKIRPQMQTDGHPAPYPPELVRRCILAGCPEGGIVLDPFFGSGTTGYQAMGLKRDFVGLELNQHFAVDIAFKKVGGEIITEFTEEVLTFSRDERVEEIIISRRRKAVEEPGTEKTPKEPKTPKEKVAREPKEKVARAPKATLEDKLAAMEL
jgi:DNA modification methylase